MSGDGEAPPGGAETESAAFRETAAPEPAGAPPLAYARGKQHFMGLELAAAPGALVPRAETELLGWTAVRMLEAIRKQRGDGAPPRIIDMCCGSGNLACAIATEVPDATIWASDLTDGCTSLARRNVEQLGLGERVFVLQGDLFAGLAGLGLEGAIDLVVCNPPYISTARLNERIDLAHEPREAFDGGPYGLAIHQRLVREAPTFLRPSGLLAFEFGLGQDRQVRLLLDRAKRYESIELIRNDAGEPRVATARKRVEA